MKAGRGAVAVSGVSNLATLESCFRVIERAFVRIVVPMSRRNVRLPSHGDKGIATETQIDKMPSILQVRCHLRITVKTVMKSSVQIVLVLPTLKHQRHQLMSKSSRKRHRFMPRVMSPQRHRQPAICRIAKSIPLSAVMTLATVGQK